MPGAGKTRPEVLDGAADIPAGDNFANAIVNGLNTARAFVLIFSSSSNKSEHVAKEVNLATGRPIFYLRTEDLRPTPPLQYFLSDIQWMDAFGFPDDQTLDKLAAVVKTAILHRPPVTPPRFQVPYRPDGLQVIFRRLNSPQLEFRSHLNLRVKHPQIWMIRLPCR